METLTSERLVLRPFIMDDLDDFYEYASLPEVGPNAGWKPHDNIDESRKILSHFIESGEVYAIVYKDNQKVIGSLGIHKKDFEDQKDVYFLGYVLHTQYRGKGLIPEAVCLALNSFFRKSNAQEICAATFIDNKASQRVLEKTGFSFVKTYMYKTLDYNERLSNLYKLSRRDFKINGGI